MIFVPFVMAVHPGRPVGVAVDQRGALPVADDVGNTIWPIGEGGS